jgi:PHP family Zn ribbon phosphoesterase
MNTEKKRRKQNEGLRLRALDLHVHTPASHDFQDKNLPLEEIAKSAKKARLDGIAVTDHNVVSAIDEMKRIAERYNLTIFPGFEISCHGAEKGPIHVLGIFDPSKNQADLERVLGKLDIKKTGEESLTSKSVTDVVDIIRESDGLPVLAHANSSHGALSDIRGNPRTELVQNPNLLAVEATGSDFEKPVGSRLLDYLNGKDPRYQRKLAVFSGSDNPAKGQGGHAAATIGNRFTYFKMGELTIEGLRQCFEDPDTRLIEFNDSEKLRVQQPRIVEVSIDGGFLGGQTIQFHSGMTSVIGATGTGKSLLIEFLRFAFDKSPHPDLKKEHLSKLEKQLRHGGVVKVKFIDLSNEEYEITRTYSAHKPPDSPTECRNCTTGQTFEGDTSSIFPILFYSQNEILEVTRDPKAQLDLLDNFRDFDRYKGELTTITGQLRSLDRRFVTSYEAAQGLPTLEKQVRTLDEKIKKCEKQIKSKAVKAFGDFDVLDKQRSAAVERGDNLDSLVAILQEAREEVVERSAEVPGKSVALESPDKEVVVHVRDAYDRVLELLDKAAALIEDGRKKANRAIKSWEKTTKYAEKKAIYEKSVKLESKLAAVETQRKKLAGERDEIKRRIGEARSANQAAAEIRGQRLGLLKKLQDVRTEYFKEREAQAKLITERSADKLKIEVRKQANNQKYSENLLRLKVKSYAEEKEIDAIVENLPVIEFVETVIDRDIKKLAKAVGLTESKAESIFNVLLQRDALSNTLALQHESFPDDQIEILYRKQDGSYHPLAELSMGQKADGLLMIALGDSQMPVVIDQPEDALDLSSIWDDVCQRLRMSKHSRQFVFTTHNSSVAVASDSDQFIVMDADATTGWVAESGSIDQGEIKTRVVEHLEGGPESYDLKRRKYNLRG